MARRSGRPASVRDGGVEDRPLTEAVDRAVRGSAHGGDIDALLAAGNRLLVVEDRGYVVAGEDRVSCSPRTTRRPARICCSPPWRRSPQDMVEMITAAQQWAVAIVLEAGLDLRLGRGAVFLRGDVGRFSRYLPSSAYL